MMRKGREGIALLCALRASSASSAVKLWFLSGKKEHRLMTEYVITTLVGTGDKGFAGDGGPANAAVLNGPFDVAFDGHGNLYFSDTFNCRIRRVDAQTGNI